MRFFKTQGEKNSSPEKTQGNFGAKTQGTGAFYANFLSKLNLLELFCRFWLKTQPVWALYWYRSFISHTKKVIEPFLHLDSLKDTFFPKTQGVFFQNSMTCFLNSRIFFSKLKEFASKLKLPELLGTVSHGQIALKKSLPKWFEILYVLYCT